jgi:thiol-disulfide isomerase/thioredoxin
VNNRVRAFFSTIWLSISLLVGLVILSACQTTSTLPAATPYPTPAPVTFIPPTRLPFPSPTPDSRIGQPVPDVVLETLDGQPIHLHNLMDGKIVFLNFWATWCEPCREEMPALQKLQDEYGSDGVRVIAITDPTSSQTEEDIRAFVADDHLSLTIGLSSDVAWYQQLGVLQVPTTFVTDRQGIIRAVHIGPLHPEDITAYLNAP